MDIKPGYQTTEFYVTLAALLVALLRTYGVFGAEEAAAWEAFLAALVPAVYIWARAAVKRGG